MNKTVLISGASSGIGRECALRLVTEGFSVIAGVRSDLARKELAEIAPGKLKAIFLPVPFLLNRFDSVRGEAESVRELRRGGLAPSAAPA